MRDVLLGSKPHVFTDESVESLAIFGGEPAFARKLYVGCPNIGNRANLMARIDDMLERKWLSNDGAYAREFERRIAEFVGVRHCIAVCNATVGLEIVIKALGLSGEVIAPAFTFIATAHALKWHDITPVFCDIDPTTHNIDPEKVERAITRRTTGIIGVHLWGKPCDIDPLSDIACRHGLKLIFDAAHAFGCSHKGCMIGRFGDAEVFSFHATKFLNSFEGGAIVTNNDALAHKANLMKNFGFAGYDEVVGVGTNGKMCEAAAAMGLTSLESIEDFLTVNRRNYLQYRHELEGIAGLRVIEYSTSERRNCQYIVLELDDSITGINRDTLLQVLHAENVIARRYFYPGCHRMEPYRSDPIRRLLPETDKVAARVFQLPTGTSVSPDDISAICAIIRVALANGGKISDRLIYQEKVIG